MTLSAGGMLTDGGAAAGTVSGVVFGYNEPNALPILTLHSGAPSGTLPYMGTVYPVEGAVPSGMSLVSPEDPSLRSSTLSAWPDGSAQVMVVHGHKTGILANSTVNLTLRPAVVSDTALTIAAITSKFTTGISVDFGGGVGTLNTWTSPDRIWWANSQVICARYRLAIPGKGTMEAVIDVHAFSSAGNALVEVVIENGKVDANAATVVLPANQPYTNATVSVNGTIIATVSSPTASMAAPNSRNSGGTCRYFGGHSASRAWYCQAEISNGVVFAPTTAAEKSALFGIEVTQDADSMMAHPWFFKRVRASAENLQTKYAQTYDNYVPWAYCRLRFPNMNGGGADEEVGLVTMTQADYLLNGNRYARRGVLQTGLAPLSADLAIRHTDGTVPLRSQVVGKNTSNGLWPRVPESNVTYQLWGGSASYIDGSHVPSIALVPFLCRPSPCFIELAQREFLFHHANYGSTDGAHSYDQARSRGWRARNMATAIFLTPDNGTWNTGGEADSVRKDGYRTALVNQINTSRNFMNQPWNTYGHIWEWTLTSFNDQLTSRADFQTGHYMHWLICLCWHSIANGKVLRGADQTMIEAAADQVMGFIMRWYSDSPGYEWRGVQYQTSVGVVSGDQIIPQFSNLIEEQMFAGTTPSAPGPWLGLGTGFNWDTATPQLVAGEGLYYPEHNWAVLCCAVERGVPGAEEAWTKVYGTSGNGGITNIQTWFDGFATARHQLNRFPRNK
jgi:hypothetical protein